MEKESKQGKPLLPGEEAAPREQVVPGEQASPKAERPSKIAYVKYDNVTGGNGDSQR